MGHRAFFNALAEKWDTICCHDRERVNHILDLAEVAPGDAVLDVGTGTGILIPFLQERIGETGIIDAVDIAETMLAVARGKTGGHNVTFIHGDILELCIEPEYYHQVLCYSVFPHFRDQARALAILSRCLKPEGRLTVCHSQSREAINHLHRNSAPAVAEDHLPSLETVIALFIAAGLKPVCGVDNERLFLVSGRKPIKSQLR
jgi:demethylmenaquinone methyltransferase/2-methoxy-6-polyprenyl-1,4-benzoquinol methylase